MHFLLSLLSRHLLVVFMLKPPRTQDTSIEYVPFDRGGKQGSEGVSEGSSSNPPNCMKVQWDEVHIVKLGILKKELFKDPKVCKAIIDRVPTPAQLLKAEGLTPKELSERMSILMCLRFLMEPKETFVLEKEKLENELLEIRAASKQDKESFAKGKSQLDLQETELEDLKHQPFIEQSETHKLKNAIIERERDLFENSSKRTSRDLFENSSRVASLPKHLLVSSPWRLVPTFNEGCIFPVGVPTDLVSVSAVCVCTDVPPLIDAFNICDTLVIVLILHFPSGVTTKSCFITSRWRLYHRSGGGYELTSESAPTKDRTLTPGNVVVVYVHSATDVASHLVAYTHERKGGYSRPSAAELISKACSA
ncbi:hypothetical protein Tco_0916458 [Tanacetum coccineum]